MSAQTAKETHVVLACYCEHCEREEGWVVVTNDYDPKAKIGKRESNHQVTAWAETKAELYLQLGWLDLLKEEAKEQQQQAVYDKISANIDEFALQSLGDHPSLKDRKAVWNNAVTVTGTELNHKDTKLFMNWFLDCN